MSASKVHGPPVLQVFYFLTTFNATLAVLWVQAQVSFSTFQTALQLRFNRMLQLRTDSDIGGNIAFFGLALILGLMGYSLLLVPAQRILSARFLATLCLLVSLFALPSAWAYVLQVRPFVPPVPVQLWFYIELAAVLTLGGVFVVSRRNYPVWIKFLVFSVHFGLWAWIFVGGPYFWRAASQFVLPLIGFVCCAIWIVSSRSKNDETEQLTNLITKGRRGIP
jgi:hypothetical protein